MLYRLYMTIVDDAVLIVSSEEIGRSKYNSMIGLAHHERVDEALYDDFETAKAREVTLIYFVFCSAFVESLILVFWLIDSCLGL